MDTPWIAYRVPRAETRLRLFCFPFAGSGALAYRTWSSELPESVEVCPVQLPGRETRMSEPRIANLEDLIPRLVDALRPWMDMPFVFFGHSFGALVAFEVTQELGRRGLCAPVRLIVSGRNAPHLPTVFPLYHYPDARLIDELRRLDPPRPEVWSNSELVALMLPLVRADLTINDTYAHRPAAPVPVPITAYCGAHDHIAPPASVEAWEKQTTGSFRCHVLPGRHFFFHHAGKGFMKTLYKELEPSSRVGAEVADA